MMAICCERVGCLDSRFGELLPPSGRRLWCYVRMYIFFDVVAGSVVQLLCLAFVEFEKFEALRGGFCSRLGRFWDRLDGADIYSDHAASCAAWNPYGMCQEVEAHCILR